MSQGAVVFFLKRGIVPAWRRQEVSPRRRRRTSFVFEFNFVFVFEFDLAFIPLFLRIIWVIPEQQSLHF
jgi:hypothetical protein